MNPILRATVVAALGAGAAPVLAQGPTAVRRIDISATGNVTYISNVARASGALVGLRGVGRSDVRYAPGVSVDIVLPVGGQVVSLNGSVGYDFYQRNSLLNRERIGLDGALAFSVSRCNGSVSAGYIRRQSDLDDLFVLPDNLTVRQRVRNAEDIKTIGASASCGPIVGLRPTASVQQSWAENSSNIRRISNYRSTSVSGGISYARPVLGTVTLFGTYSTTKYPNNSNLLGFTQNAGFDSKAAGIRFERAIGSRLTGLAEISYTTTASDQGGIDDFKGLTYRAQLGAALTDALYATLNVSRDVRPSNRVGAGYSVGEIYDVGARYIVNEKLSFNANALLRKRNYRANFTPLLPLTKDNLRSVSGGAAYKINRRLTASASVGYDDRQGNGTLFDYDVTQVRAGLALRL